MDGGSAGGGRGGGGGGGGGGGQHVGWRRGVKHVVEVLHGAHSLRACEVLTLERTGRLSHGMYMLPPVAHAPCESRSPLAATTCPAPLGPQAFAAYATARNTTLEAIAATPLAIAQIILPHLALGQQLPASALTDGTIVSTGDPRFFAAQLEVDVDAATGAVRVFRRGNPAAAATVLQADVTVGLPGRPDIIVHVIDKVIE